MDRNIIDTVKSINENITDSSKQRLVSLLSMLIILNINPIKIKTSSIYNILEILDRNERKLKRIITDDIVIKSNKISNENKIKHEYSYIYEYIKTLHLGGNLDKILKKLDVPNEYNINIITSLTNNNEYKFNETINKLLYIMPSFLYYLFRLPKELGSSKLMNKKHIYFDIPIPDNMYDNPFMSIENYKWIEDNVVEYKKVLYDNISLDIYSGKKIQDNEIKEIIRIIKVFKTLTNTETVEIRCNIFLTDMEKYVDINDIILTNNQVNTGSTIRKEIINIWRIEELQKVLFHELIHYIGYDIVDNNDTINDQLLKKIKMCKWCFIRANESYVDCIAIIMNSVYNSYKHVGKNYSTVSWIFNIFFKIDIYYTLYQTSNILYLNGYNKIDEIYEKEFTQYSNAMSYYIIKSALLFNINDTLDFFMKQSNTFRFNDTIGNVNKYYKLIIRSLDNISYKKTINDMIGYIKNNINMKNKKISMRMTCIDMK